jgi:hypothetical protein
LEECLVQLTEKVPYSFDSLLLTKPFSHHWDL